MKPVPSFSHLSDGDVITTALHLAADERQATAALIACLVEVDTRRLYLGEGCSSLFAWCTEVLHLSGDAAYGRIEVARAARRYPIVLEALANGSVTMSAIAALRPHFTDANHRALLAQARHKSKRDVEQLIAALAPKPDVAASVRKLPTPSTLAPNRDREMAALLCDAPAPPIGSAESIASPAAPAPPAPAPTTAASHRPAIAPLAPERFRIQFTMSRATHDRLRRAQDLLRHAIPSGDPAAIFDRALATLIARLERQKWAAAGRPRATSDRAPKGRTIPAGVRRAVARRDEGRCAFVGTQGRCTTTAFLEFHHIVPYARGGTATEDNLQLRCRAHNQFEAARDFPDLLRERPICYATSGAHELSSTTRMRSAPDHARRPPIPASTNRRLIRYTVDVPIPTCGHSSHRGPGVGGEENLRSLDPANGPAAARERLQLVTVLDSQRDASAACPIEAATGQTPAGAGVFSTFDSRLKLTETGSTRRSVWRSRRTSSHVRGRRSAITRRRRGGRRPKTVAGCKASPRARSSS